MAQLSPFAMVHTLDQWRRVAHVNTALDDTNDPLAVVQLAWMSDMRVDKDSDEQESHVVAGLAFDPWCRLYRALPEEGQIVRLLWARTNASAEANANEESVALFSPELEQFGDFSLASGKNDREQATNNRGPLLNPTDIIIDHQGRLFIAEQGRKRILLFDLVENKLLAQFSFKRAPLKLATDGQQVWVLFDTQGDATDDNKTIELVVLDGRLEPRYLTLPEFITLPTAIAVNMGTLYVLDKGGSENATVYPLGYADDAFTVPYAKELLFADDNILIVARRSAEDFLRFKLEEGTQSELPYLKARHYDGRGIALTPSGQVAYWSDRGLLRATLARVRYEPQGRVVSFQLDSGNFQTQWGRLLIDACLPRGTTIKAQCLSLDEIPQTAPALARTLPDNVLGVTVHRPDLSPPMPPEVLLNNLSTMQTFHRRNHGNELPWQPCRDEDHFQTYEAPVIAPPGRYLWVVLMLTGTARLTPKIKSLRAEHPSHDLLRRLPQVYSRDLAVADFLRRYLAMPEGDLRDLDLRASYRHLLLDPYAAPTELLPWLGGFMGLVIDKRWPERAKRQLVANGIWLFRYRGTVMGLKRFIEIYLDSKVTIIESFKVRGLGGSLLGEEDALSSNSVLGAGFRIGGKLGSEEIESINDVSIEDAITSHAHRFSLIIATSLSSEQQAVVEHLLETHRPAHTVYDICTVDAGMRVGTGLNIGLTSIIGNTSGFGQLQVGGSLLGYTDTLGIAKPGTTIGGSRLGGDSRVG